MISRSPFQPLPFCDTSHAPHGLCLLADEMISGNKLWDLGILYFILFSLSTDYSDLAWYTCSAATQSTHIRKTYHPFPSSRVRQTSTFSVYEWNIQKSKSNGWKSNSEFDSVPHTCDYSYQVHCIFSSADISMSFFKVGFQKLTQKQKRSYFHHHY